MTKKEMVRIKVAKRLANGEMKVRQAARILMLPTRKVIGIK